MIRSLQGALMAGSMVFAATTTPLQAQEVSAPAVWAVAHGDSVTIQLPRVPAGFQGFHVYRATAGTDFVRITGAPVAPIRDPSLLAAALGEDLAQLQDRTRAATELQAARRLQMDPVVGALYSYVFPSAARGLGLRFTDPEAPSGSMRRYRVALVDAAGEETGEVREASVGAATPLPTAPSSLAAEPEDGRVILTWGYPAYRGAPDDVTSGFHVYRAEGDSDRFERQTASPLLRNDVTQPTWEDREVRNGQAYRYRVRAVDIVGREGSPSPAAAVTPADPLPPAVPRGLRTFPGEGSVRLAWLISPEQDLSGYRVERSTGLDQPFAPVGPARIAPEEPVWADSTVTGGVQYYYRVIAVDDAGRESRPGNPVAAVPWDTTPPAAPVELSATVEDRVLQLTWTRPEGEALSGYHVYRGESRETLVRLTPEPVDATFFRDPGPEGTGLAPGGRFVVRVTAVDSLLNESAGVEAEVVVPDDQAPAAPSSLTVTNPNGRELQLAWNASPALDVARYVLVRTVSGPAGPVQEPGITPRVDTVAAGAPRSLRQGDVVGGVEYRFEVFAEDSAGNRSPPTATRHVFRDGTPPPAPNFVEVAGTSAGLVIRWERTVAGDLAGYRVQRADLPTGRFQDVSPLVTPGSPRSWTDPDPLPEGFYRVVAVDRSGNRSDPSPVASPGGTP